MERQFLVKPQGLFRVDAPKPLVDTESESEYMPSDLEEEDSEADANNADPATKENGNNGEDSDDYNDANTSMDSYGKAVKAKVGLKGSGMPDFIVAKAGLGGKPDMALLIFEVKKANAYRGYGRTSLCMYMYRAHRKTRSPHLAGLLVCGGETEVYELDKKVLARMMKQDMSPWKCQRIFTTAEAEFNNYINKIATFHWDNE
ncbi:hypothetical protein HYPSUDRAFT_57662 [Hypholoma sublateritium FD-334 SS-4]|uniref:Uncharacterized protein n=1 Tax=Hypholoma sublateritium (strain FD-334 SS-4) TaxID=945553 RepID=A0A0D2NLI3_HYPSF|nr:hypothetical protein HYPSUDRAFT_57662 [Hypholoma sublateritium FD-334 SS-4]